MKVLLENIVSFQSIESFNEATGLIYDELSEDELFNALIDWHYPGEHDANWYEADDINTNFLGYEYLKNKKYLLSTYDRGLIIGLSYILERGE